MRLFRDTSSDVLPLALACVVLGALLASIVVAGPFTNEEAHYLATITALRGGTFHLENTAGLMPSRELLAFGAYDYLSTVNATPVAPVAPPLYAFLALPFSYSGFRPLIFLNTLAFLATGVMVFRLAKHHASRRITAWLAVFLYWFASFSLEYALGMWPHCIAVMLCTGAVLLVHRAANEGRVVRAALAGLLIGVATGVRYQESLFGALLGVTLVYWCLSPPQAIAETPRQARIARAARLAVAYGAGTIAPLVLSAYVNHVRLGAWNPITEGGGYSPIDSAHAAAPSFWKSTIWTFAMKVIDFSLCPPFQQLGSAESFRPSTLSGAVVYGGVVKKALLQSSPWLMLAFLGLALAWRSVGGLPDRARRELRGISIIVFGVIVAFSFAGLKRTEGFCFNMRYFLELMPLCAIATAWLVQRYAGWKPILSVASLLGAIPALVVLLIPAASPERHVMILRAPLVLASMLAIASLHARRTERGRWLGPTFAACVGWAVIVHAGDDVLTALKMRARQEYYMDIVEPELSPQKTALIAYSGAATQFAPLTLKYELTIVDPFLDGGKTARPLTDQLLAHGFRVILMPQKMPGAIYNAIVEGRPVREMQADALRLLDLSPATPPL